MPSWYGTRIARVQTADGRVARIEVPANATAEQITAMADQVVPKPKGRTDTGIGGRPQQQSTLSQIGDAFTNDTAGLAEGALSLADMAWEGGKVVRRGVAKGLDAAGTTALNAVGLPGAADWWHRGAQGVSRDLATGPLPSTPITNAFPVPNTMSGKVSRIASQFIGGAAVPVGPKVTPPLRFPKAASAPKGVDLDLIRAGQRQGIPIRRPDAIPALRGEMATAEASPYGGPHIARTLSADKDLIQQRLAAVGGPGNIQTEAYNLGQQIQGVGKNFIERTRRVADKNYKQASELAQGQRVAPQNAVSEIDRNIAELSAAGANSNAPTIRYLQGLKADMMKPGGFAIEEFQGLRSAARNTIKGDNALTASDADRRLGNVVRAFTSDAQEQLPKEASAALAQADDFYAKRQQFINGTLRNLLGSRGKPLPAETAASRLQAMAKNRADYDTFTSFWHEADPATRADFSATFANGLGGKNDKFGLGTLATDISSVPRNIRQTMYGKEGATALDDLRTIARAKSDTATGLNNSRSGVVMARSAAKRAVPLLIGGGILGGPMGAAVAPIAGEGVAALSQLHTAHGLLNPDFAKLLTQGATSSVNEVAAPYAVRAPLAMAVNPTVRSEMGGLLDSPYLSRLAAEEAEQKKKKKR